MSAAIIKKTFQAGWLGLAGRPAGWMVGCLLAGRLTFWASIPQALLQVLASSGAPAFERAKPPALKLPSPMQSIPPALGLSADPTLKPSLAFPPGPWCYNIWIVWRGRAYCQVLSMLSGSSAA